MFRLVPSLTRLRGALDREQGAQAWAATQPLKQAGVQLFQNKPGTGDALRCLRRGSTMSFDLGKACYL
jgi:hypothetical protein